MYRFVYCQDKARSLLCLINGLILNILCNGGIAPCRNHSAVNARQCAVVVFLDSGKTVIIRSREAENLRGKRRIGIVTLNVLVNHNDRAEALLLIVLIKESALYKGFQLILCFFFHLGFDAYAVVLLI